MVLELVDFTTILVWTIPLKPINKNSLPCWRLLIFLEIQFGLVQVVVVLEDVLVPGRIALACMRSHQRLIHMVIYVFVEFDDCTVKHRSHDDTEVIGGGTRKISVADHAGGILQAIDSIGWLH